MISALQLYDWEKSFWIGKKTLIWHWEWGLICCAYRVGLAQSVACPPLTLQVVVLSLGRVIPKTIIKMVQTASLHGKQCVRVGVWQ